VGVERSLDAARTTARATSSVEQMRLELTINQHFADYLQPGYNLLRDQKKRRVMTVEDGVKMTPKPGSQRSDGFAPDR